MQRIFRELIKAGYVKQGAQRFANGRFGKLDYVIRDVPEPVENLAMPQVPKGPTVKAEKAPKNGKSPQVPKGPTYKNEDTKTLGLRICEQAGRQLASKVLTRDLTDTQSIEQRKHQHIAEAFGGWSELMPFAEQLDALINEFDSRSRRRLR